MSPVLLVDEVEDDEEEGVYAEDYKEKDNHLHLLLEEVLAVQQLDFSVLNRGNKVLVVIID